MKEEVHFQIEGSVLLFYENSCVSLKELVN